MEIDAYNGGLNLEELVDWINTMDKHFDFVEMPEDKKVKFAVTRLKGHVLLRWDGVLYMKFHPCNLGSGVTNLLLDLHTINFYRN